MKRKRKVFTTFIFILFLVFAKIHCQAYDIEYYGIVSEEIDSNMAKMTSDLYFTQLSKINNFNVTDKREFPMLSAPPDATLFSKYALSFYATVRKIETDDSWIVIFHVVDKANEEEHSKQKKYASFYKILMESKTELEETIRQLIENDKGDPIRDSRQNQEKKSASENSNSNGPKRQTAEFISAENLSGTWKGEENIDKIVILRGGRGFVIFKNGASMNITIETSEKNKNQIIFTQNSKSNASFFPELPRAVALTAAPNAEPIQWILSIFDGATLRGTKITLIPDGDSFKKGEISVEWTKSN